MGKLGLLLLLIVALLLWFKWQSRIKDAGPRRGPRGPSAGPAQKMLPCHACGTHVPAQEAVYDAEGRSYCCGAHADAAARGR